MNEPSTAERAVHDLAEIIREVDGDNRMSATSLGATLASRICVFYNDLYAAEVMAFVERTNPDKKMGAGQLAELLVAEFRLDEEN